MTIDKFGSGGKSTTISKNYVDSKFITLVKSLNLKFDKTGGKISGHIDMNGHRIANVGNPTLNEDAVNKGYLESNAFCMSSTGLIPHAMSSNIDTTGYIINESSRMNENTAGYRAFTVNKNSSWRVANEVSENFWLSVRCPKVERVYRVSIRAVEGTKIMKWVVQGLTVDDGYHNWIDLPFKTEPVYDTTRHFEISPNLTRDFIIYRIFVLESEGKHPGLSYLQFFQLNPIILIN